MFPQASLFACTAAALVSICYATSPLASPCPELFRYESVDNQGYWTGNLILRSDHDLRGVWIRLIFDKEVKDLTVDSPQPGFIIKHTSEDKKLVKVQNPTLFSKANTPQILKIKVTYEGKEVPSLIEYRLNARTICPQTNYDRFDIFRGDYNSDYFLPSLWSKPNVHPLPYQCGIPYPSNLYPWQSALYIDIGKEEKYACEAVLISPSHVVTAGHCVTFINSSTVIPRAFVRVYLGPDGASKGALKTFVRNIEVHPGYESGSLTDDIAILELVDPVDITKEYRPICLGTEKKLDDKEFVTGYEIGKDGKVGNLLESNVVRIANKECVTSSPHLEKVFSDHELASSYPQGPSTYDAYCLSYKSGEKSCVGDSGSALVSLGHGRATLRGLVTLGVRLQNKNGCDDKTNVVVADIHRYVSWINKIIY